MNPPLRLRTAAITLAVLMSPCIYPCLAAEPTENITAAQVREARVHVKQAEVDLIRAHLDLKQLEGQRDVERLQEQLHTAEAALAELNKAAAQADGFVMKWLVLGPVALDEKVSNHDEASCKDFLDRQYIPADATPNDGDKTTIDNAELTWKTVEAEDYYIDLAKMADDAGKDPEHAAFVGIVYVISDEELAGVKIAVGSDDDSVWRLNGKEILRAYEGRDVQKDQQTADNLTLKKGVNVLSFTVLNGDGASAAAARVLDKDDNVPKGVTYGLKPPAAPETQGTK